MDRMHDLSNSLSITDQIAIIRDLLQGVPAMGMPIAKLTTAIEQPAIGGMTAIDLDINDWITPSLVILIGDTEAGVWGLYVVTEASSDGTVTARRLDPGDLFTSAAEGSILPVGSRCTVSAYVPDSSIRSAIAPSGVGVTILNGIAHISWDALTDDEELFCDEVAVTWGESASNDPVGGQVVTVVPAGTGVEIALPDYGTYWFRVSGRLNGRLSSTSTSVSATYSSPSLPGNVVASISGSVLSIGWDDIGDLSLRAVVEYWEDGTSTRFRIVAEPGSTGVSVSLQDAGTWRYGVAIEDSNGVVGSFTPQESIAFGGVSAPYGSSFSVSGGVLTAEWSNADYTDVVVLEWRRSETSGGAATSNGLIQALSRNGATSISMNVSPGYYFARLWNVYKNIWSPVGEPEDGKWIHVENVSAPQNVEAAINGASAEISWDAVDGADYIYVKYWPVNNPEITSDDWTRSMLLDGDSTSVSIFVQKSGDYNFKVGSKKRDGDVVWAIQSTFSIATPTLPTSVSGSNNEGSVTISWDSLIADDTVYSVEVQVDVDSSDGESSFALVAYVPKNDVSYTHDQGVGNSYAYRVRSVDIFGNHSEWVTITVAS